MNIIIVPGKTESRCSTCLSHRQLALMALCGLVVLPLIVGGVIYRIHEMLNGPRGLNAEVVTAYRAELNAQHAAIAATRTRAETHVNA
ncbi:MAG: hypothetical protein V3T69_11810, partial [Acidiferrobacterales bacterium]